MKQKKKENDQPNKAWIRALVIITIFTLFSLACSFVFVKLLPSKISLQIKTVTDIFSLGGGVAIFYIIFKLLYSSFKKLLPFLVLLIIAVIVINLVVFLHYNDLVKSEINKLVARTRSLNNGLKSTDSELNRIKSDFNRSHLLFLKIQDQESVNVMVRVIEKSSSELICQDMLMKNRTLRLPLAKIKILSENQDFSIIRVPHKLYLESLEKKDSPASGKFMKEH